MCTFRTRFWLPGRLMTMMHWVCWHFLQHSPGTSTSSKPCRTPGGSASTEEGLRGDGGGRAAPVWAGAAYVVAGGVARHVGAGDGVELRGVLSVFGAHAVLALGGEDWRTGLRAQGGRVRRGLQGTSPPPGHRPPSPAGELGAPGAESPQSRAPHRASQEPVKPHAPKPPVHPAPLPAARQGSPGTQRS